MLSFCLLLIVHVYVLLVYYICCGSTDRSSWPDAAVEKRCLICNYCFHSFCRIYFPGLLSSECRAVVSGKVIDYLLCFKYSSLIVYGTNVEGVVKCGGELTSFI